MGLMEPQLGGKYIRSLNLALAIFTYDESYTCRGQCIKILRTLHYGQPSAEGKRKAGLLEICHIEAMRVVMKRRERKSTSSMDIVKRKRKTVAQEACPTTTKKKGMLYTMNQQPSIHIC